MGAKSGGIREVQVTKKPDGSYKTVRVKFGPHHMLEVLSGNGDQVEFRLVATHHGFKADASELNGPLEQIIYEIRKSRPDNNVD